MKTRYFNVLTVLSIMVLLASCGSMNKERAAQGSGGMEQEWVSDGEFGSQRVKGQEGNAAFYTTEMETGSDTLLGNIFFDYDKYNIREDARPVLDTTASVLNDNKEQNIIIEGHTDERGTNEYNLALGEKRARATMRYLRSLGVSPNRMTIMTFGEEKPACSAQDETCWQRNRRALIK